MKKLFRNKLLLTLTLFAFTVPVSAVMDTTHEMGYRVRAKIPFAFNAGETPLPAGNYVITRTSDVEPSMKITDESKNIDVYLVVDDMHETMNLQAPELIFHKIGGKDFLSEIKTENTIYTFETTPLEKQLEKNGEKFGTHKLTGMHIKD